jgi:hypothetical protein
VLVPTLSEALKATMTINCFSEAVAGNSKKKSQIVDIKEHLENQYYALYSRQKKITDFSP